MVKYERHPAPEKLLRQMTVETVNLLALGGPDGAQDAALQLADALDFDEWIRESTPDKNQN